MRYKLFYQLASFLLAVSLIMTGPAAFALTSYGAHNESIADLESDSPEADAHTETLSDEDTASEPPDDEPDGNPNESDENTDPPFPSDENTEKDGQGDHELKPAPEIPDTQGETDEDSDEDLPAAEPNEEIPPAVLPPDMLPLFQPMSGSLNAVYLSGSGNDSKDGTTAAPVKTFAKAKELLAPDGVIYINGTVTLSANDEWSLAGYGDAKVMRAPGFTGNLIQTGKYELTLSDITIDGGGDSVPNVSGSLIKTSTANGSLVIQDGTILQNNYSSTSGSAIYTNVASTISISGDVKIIGNSSGSTGGAIYSAGSSTKPISISISGGVQITGNSASGNGGAIYSADTTLDISGGVQIMNNSTSGNGGGIYTTSAPLTISDSTYLLQNEAASGGAIYANSGTLEISSGSILSNNRALTGTGGAIHIQSGAIVTIADAVLFENQSAGNGGAIYSVGSLTVKDNVNFRQNNSANGGAVYYTGAQNNFTISGSNILFTENSADNGGAIYISAFTSGNISDAQFTGNTAFTHGGALYIGPSATTYPVSDVSFSGNRASTAFGDDAELSTISALTVTAGFESALNNYDIWHNSAKASRAKGHLVTYHLNDEEGSIISAVFYAEDEIPDEDAHNAVSPIRSGYNFTKWFTDADCSAEYTYSSAPIAAYLDLYAGWELMQGAVVVTFEYNYSGAGTYTTRAVSANNPVAEPAAPSRTGYRFAGWYKESACDNLHDFENDMISAATTLYANWVKTYTITYYLNYLTGTQDMYQRDTYDANATITFPPAPERPGYIFGGWRNGKQGSIVTPTTATVDMSLYADWSVDSSGSTIFLSGSGSDTNNGFTPETPVGSFEKAAELVANGGTIYISSTIEITSGDITFDRGSSNKDFVLKRHAGFTGNLISVSGENTHLTLDNIVLDGNSEALHPQTGGATMIYVTGGAKLTVTNGSVLRNNYTTNTYTGGALHITGSDAVPSVVTITNGSTIKNNHLYANVNEGSGGIYVSHSKLYIDDSTLCDNTTTRDGGAIFAKSGSLVVINDSTISNNHALLHPANENGPNGGGIHTEGSTLRISGSTEIFENTVENGASPSGSNTPSKSSGGGISINASYESYPSETIISSGVQIKDNTAQVGGGIYSTTGTLTISDGVVISGNEGTVYGGGLYLISSKVLIEGQNTEISNNTSPLGGGIYVRQNNKGIQIKGGAVVKENTATQYGGGIYIYQNENDDALIEISGAGTKVAENSAVSGGGIYIHSNTAGTRIEDGASIESNEATQFGGGIYINHGEVDIRGAETQVSHNTAENKGGGVYLSFSIVTETSGQKEYQGTLLLHESASIDNNTAGSADTLDVGDGGGIYIMGGTYTYLLSGAKIDNNKAYNNGGGIYCEKDAHGTVRESFANYNSAWNNGGAAYSEGSLVLREGVSLYGNTAGARYFDTTYTDTFWQDIYDDKDNLLGGNNHNKQPTDAGGNGGGIYILDGYLYIMEGAAFEGNLADFGGGVFIHSGTDYALITGSKLDTSTLNTLNSIVVPPSEQPQYSTYYPSIFFNNLAYYDGGGIYTHSLDILVVDTVVFTDNLATERVEALEDRVALLHELNVINTAYSGQYDFAYNNFDINYQNKSALDVSEFIAGIIYYLNDGTQEVHYRDIRLGDNASTTVTVTDRDRPEDPERTDYDFIGWTLDEAGTQAFSYPVTLKNDTLVRVYAQWSNDSGETPGGGGSGGGSGSPLTVTFHWNDGREDDIYHQTMLPRGARVAKPEDPARENFTFGGWYYEPECLSEYDFDTPVTRNLDLYARWSAELTVDFAPEHYAYLVGYPGGTIRPDAQITRAEIATIFFRMISDDYREEIWKQDNAYSDVVLNHWHNNAVSVMSGDGVFHGYPDGTFHPDAPITRAELAATVARFTNASYSGENLFTDIAGHWAADEINRAASFGWITGDGDGTFRPDDYITRAEAATLVNRVLGRLPQSAEDLLDEMIVWPDNRNAGAWYYLAIQEATNSHQHILKADGIHESWTAFLQPRDWTLLEKTDSLPQSIR